jgi:ParB-like chromosome segregation protein Spo0J
MKVQLGLFAQDVADKASEAFKDLGDMDMESRVEAINAIRLELHKYSPFIAEPVDCVLWVPSGDVTANDYNPNSVAPPEMRLLETSIGEDGYTQPIVTWMDNGHREVIDGFHRHRVGVECGSVRKRIMGYLPVTTVNQERTDRGDRIASTIRHNRARGKHKIAAMSDIVIELKRRNWTDEKIGRELGMDPDEVLRLTQITGLAEMFLDSDFTQSWDTDEVSESEIVLADEPEVDEQL